MGRLRRASATLALLLAVAACAPDAFGPRSAARGFDAYLATLKGSCPNLVIGGSDIGNGLRYGAGDDNYSYWLDMTSRLYYGRISPAGYEAALAAQLGPGRGNDAAFDCIVGHLPPRRG